MRYFKGFGAESFEGGKALIWRKAKDESSNPLKVKETLYSKPFEFMMVETSDGLSESLVAKSFECMMVETTDGFDKNTKEELKVFYPQAREDLPDFQEKCIVSGSKAVLCPRCNVVSMRKPLKSMKLTRKRN